MQQNGSVFNSSLPSLESPESKNNMLYIQAMNIARQAYISAESSDRVERALLHPIRTSEDMFLIRIRYFTRGMIVIDGVAQQLL